MYLLIGLIWAVLYTLIQLTFAGSFTNISSNNEWFSLFPDFIYFSFVTITTLGFGDISPVLPISRFLVYFEAIVGQFYLAILVASLVGSHMSNFGANHNSHQQNSPQHSSANNKSTKNNQLKNAPNEPPNTCS